MKKIRRRASQRVGQRVFHGTSGRIEIGYKELFINGEKAPQTDRQRMREMTIRTFCLCYLIILIIVKVATRFYNSFSFNPHRKQ